MADIIAFPIADLPHPAADTAGTLRRGLRGLADAAARLHRSSARLKCQHDVLDRVKGRLDVEALRARAIATLAGAIERAIAADDLPAMIALQAELHGLVTGAGRRPEAAAPRLTDAAD